MYVVCFLSYKVQPLDFDFWTFGLLEILDCVYGYCDLEANGDGDSEE